MAELDDTAESATAQFRESSQFQRDLFSVDFEPAKMRAFLQDLQRQGKSMSPYALGCMYATMKAYFGEEEAEKLADTVRKDLGLTISNKNETNYFSETEMTSMLEKRERKRAWNREIK